MTEDHFPSEGQTSFDPETGPEEPPDQPAPTGAAGRHRGDPVAEGTGDATDPGEPEDELGQALAQVAGLTNDLQRLQAEYVNYKRRVDRDRDLVLENARFAVLSAFLPVLDDLDRARDHGELDGGFKAVADSLERIVAAQGLVKFGAPGDEFDPRFHEALMHAHSPEVSTTTCQDVVTAGYQIGDRVVRPAKVTVVDPEPASDSGSDPGSDAGSDAGGAPDA